jgi:hypothetical protein
MSNSRQSSTAANHVPSIHNNTKSRASDPASDPAMPSRAPASTMISTRDHSLESQTRTIQPSDNTEARTKGKFNSNQVHTKDRNVPSDVPTLASGGGSASASVTNVRDKITVAGNSNHAADKLNAGVSGSFKSHNNTQAQKLEIQQHKSQTAVLTETSNDGVVTCNDGTGTANRETHDDDAPISSEDLVKEEALCSNKRATPRKCTQSLPVRLSPKMNSGSPTPLAPANSIDNDSHTMDPPVSTDNQGDLCTTTPPVVSSQLSSEETAIPSEPVPEQEQKRTGQPQPAENSSLYPGPNYSINGGTHTMVHPAPTPGQQLPGRSLGAPSFNDGSGTLANQQYLIPGSSNGYTPPSHYYTPTGTFPGYSYSQYPGPHRYGYQLPQMNYQSLPMGSQPPGMVSQPPPGPSFNPSMQQPPYTSHPGVSSPGARSPLPSSVSTQMDSGYQSPPAREYRGYRIGNTSGMGSMYGSTAGDDAAPGAARENSFKNVGGGNVSQENQEALPETTPANDVSQGPQKNTFEGAEADNAVPGPQESVDGGPQPLENSPDSQANPAELGQPSIFGCTFCTRDCTPTLEQPTILCPCCGPTSNIRYCSQACIVGDAYGHKVRCQMYPAPGRVRSHANLPSEYVYFQDPIMPMHPSQDSREKFRQKTFMMFCFEGAFPQILRAWGRRAGNTIPRGVDIEETGKKTGSYYVFRSTATAPPTDPNKIYMPGQRKYYDRFNHDADVIFVSYFCCLFVVNES